MQHCTRAVVQCDTALYTAVSRCLMQKCQDGPSGNGRNPIHPKSRHILSSYRVQVLSLFGGPTSGKRESLRLVDLPFVVEITIACSPFCPLNTVRRWARERRSAGRILPGAKTDLFSLVELKTLHRYHPL